MDEEVLQAKRLRGAIDEGDQVAGEALLQVSLLVQVVEHDGCIDAALDLHHDAHPLPVALIPHVRHACGSLGGLHRSSRSASRLTEEML